MNFDNRNNKHILYIEKYGDSKNSQYRLSGIMGVIEPGGDELYEFYEGDPLVTSIKFDEVRFIDPMFMDSSATAGPLRRMGYSQDRDMRSM